MTNVKYYMFYLIIFLAIIFGLRSLGNSKTTLPPGQRDLGNELFTDTEVSSSTQELEEDLLF